MRTLHILLFVITIAISTSVQADDRRPRLFVLTDIENEPDDAQSMVRLLVHSSQYRIEGLVAITSVWLPNRTAPERIRTIVRAYGQVRDQLARHEDGFPTAASLEQVISSGLPLFGMQAVGEGKDSAGSNALIVAADRSDPDPLWIAAWGGTNVLAQALWKVSHSRSKEQLAQFVAKLRVYAISDQDDSGPWIRATFPELFYIVSPGYEENDGGGYHYATWAGISGDKFHGRFDGADFSLVSNEWLTKNIIENHGPLGQQYPPWKYLMEGDTPSFLYLFPNGLGAAEHPNFGSWGGRYELYTPHLRPWYRQAETRPIWTNAEDEVIGNDDRPHNSIYATIFRWRSAYQNEFAARMDWSIKDPKDANHPPAARVAHSDNLIAHPGDTLNLSARGSSDPDGDQLSFRWFAYREAGNYGGNTQFGDATQRDTTLKLPKIGHPGEPVAFPKTLHVILEVTDKGKPALTRYRRVIVNIEAPTTS
jgi:Protein of unknown function (DUF1593)